MPRDPDALKLIEADDKWAGSEDADVLAPEDDEDNLLGVTEKGRNIGFDEKYSEATGQNPERELFNQLFRELSGAVIEVNQHGAGLEWDEDITYDHPAIVAHDGNYYRSRENSEANKGQTPENISTFWELIIITAATQDNITTTGSRLSNRVVTPASLPDATTTTRGLVPGIATSDEISGGNNTDKYITPNRLRSSNYQHTSENTISSPSAWNVSNAPVGNLTISADGTLAGFTGATQGGVYVLHVTASGGTHALTLNTSDYQLGDRHQPDNIPSGETVLLGFMYINSTRYYIGELTGF